jgi:hypothetical protein
MYQCMILKNCRHKRLPLGTRMSYWRLTEQTFAIAQFLPGYLQGRRSRDENTAMNFAPTTRV